MVRQGPGIQYVNAFEVGTGFTTLHRIFDSWRGQNRQASAPRPIVEDPSPLNLLFYISDFHTLFFYSIHFSLAESRL
jgi:hypothetical protein